MWGVGVRVFMTRWFARYARKERLIDAALGDAVARAGRGQIDADLGGGVIKQRVARPGQGRSGGYRMILLYRRGARAIFAFGYAKNRKEDLELDELEAYRELAKAYLAVTEREIDRYVADGILIEVTSDEQEQQ
jgi:hypothetical protein